VEVMGMKIAVAIIGLVMIVPWAAFGIHAYKEIRERK
jgi:hypothetical protein